MALATQCPHCHTTFRVAHDQLKLRAGLVRCGSCKQIFNGIENLLRAEDLPPQPPSPAAAPATATPPASADVGTFAGKSSSGVTASDGSADVIPAATGDVIADNETRNEPADLAAETASTVPAEESKEDPLLRMTLMDFTHEEPEQAEAGNEQPPALPEDKLDEVEKAIDDLNNKPWREQQETDKPADADELDRLEASDYVEPAFVRQARRKQRIGRVVRIFMAIASVILALTAVGQSAYIFRDQIAAWFPQTKPILAQACAELGCQVGLPAHIDNVSIESSELQALAANANTFSLTVLLRNHGATEQAWPSIELMLNDSNETPIARRVFTPKEYLAAMPDAKAGLAARSEQPVKLFFQLSQLKAAGYRVYLFYP